MADSIAVDPAAAAAPAIHRATVRDYAFTLILVFVILSATRQDAGFVLPLLSPFLLAWFVRLAWIAWQRPPRRKVQAVKFVCVVAAVMLATFVQNNVQRQARAHAQQVVATISTYRAQHGSYPDDLAQAGLDENALRRWRVRYVNHEGQHHVVHPAVFSVYDEYVYDLDKPGWNATVE